MGQTLNQRLPVTGRVAWMDRLEGVARIPDRGPKRGAIVVVSILADGDGLSLRTHTIGTSDSAP